VARGGAITCTNGVSCIQHLQPLNDDDSYSCSWSHVKFEGVGRGRGRPSQHGI